MKYVQWKGGANVPDAISLYGRINEGENSLLNNLYNPAYGMIGGQING